MSMIENSDRGITLNKGLAWTIVSALVAGSIWIGTQTSSATSGIETLKEQVTEVKGDTKAQLNDIKNRVRSLEGQSNRLAVDARHVNSELNEVQQQLRENNQLLRRLLQQSQTNQTR